MRISTKTNRKFKTLKNQILNLEFLSPNLIIFKELQILFKEFKPLKILK